MTFPFSGGVNLVYGSGFEWKVKGLLTAFCESIASTTRLVAIKSLIKWLQEEKLSEIAHAIQIRHEKVSLPYICRGFFDPCEEVQRASAEYFMACVPTFAGEDRVQTLPHELICQFICFGEHVTDQTVSNPGMLKACQDICRKLDGHWPRWAGWQEGLKDPDHSVEALASQVSIAMLRYLRRRFSQWQHDQHDLAQGNALQQQHHEAGSMS